MHQPNKVGINKLCYGLSAVGNSRLLTYGTITNSAKTIAYYLPYLVGAFFLPSTLCVEGVLHTILEMCGEPKPEAPRNMGRAYIFATT